MAIKKNKDNLKISSISDTICILEIKCPHCRTSTKFIEDSQGIPKKYLNEKGMVIERKNRTYYAEVCCKSCYDQAKRNTIKIKEENKGLKSRLKNIDKEYSEIENSVDMLKKMRKNLDVVDSDSSLII